MAANRLVLPILLAVGMTSLPACVTTFVNEPLEPPKQFTPKDRTEFAMYPKVPGERVALHAPEKVVAVAAEPPPVEPPEPVGPSLAAPSPTLDPLLVRVVRAYIENKPAEAIELLAGLDRPTQDLLLQLIPAVVQASQMNLGKAGPLEVMALSGQLDKAAAGLAAKAPLMIEKICFCEELKSFGHYKPLANQQVLRAGRLAMLYAEIRNTPCEPVSDPVEGEGFVTKLVGSIELRDGNGAVIEMIDRHGKRVPRIQDTKQDFSRSVVRDYFMLFKFDTPQKPGTYVVTIEVRDPQSGRAVSKPIAFKVQ